MALLCPQHLSAQAVAAPNPLVVSPRPPNSSSGLHQTSPGVNKPATADYSAPALAGINGISYWGGPVLSQPIHVYFIWYGHWSGSTTPAILADLITNLGSSPYWGVETTYYDFFNRYVSSAVQLSGSTNDYYSRGLSLQNNDFQYIAMAAVDSGSLGPFDPNGVYFVLTSADVSVNGFKSSFCGFHNYANRYNFAELGSSTLKYAFVGDANGNANCMAQTSVSPNGNPSADAMANIVAHELEELANDPEFTGWYQSNTSGESADLCNWKFGTELTAANGSLFNVSIGTRQFLLQQNWANQEGGSCSLSSGNGALPSSWVTVVSKNSGQCLEPHWNNGLAGEEPTSNFR
jgi:hypothetical protein